MCNWPYLCLLYVQPALNKLPTVNGEDGSGHKRPLTDENADPSLLQPHTKQPRLIEVELPEVTADENRPTGECVPVWEVT